MFNFFRRSKSVLPPVTLIFNCYDWLSSAHNISEIDLEKFASLSVIQRWQLTSMVLSKNNRKAMHFFHVPKTGGTTFGETLGQRQDIHYIAVDGSVELFIRSLLAVFQVKNKYIITRGHHSLSILTEAQELSMFLSMFTFFRPAIDIHVSNVNMILRRLKCFQNDETLSPLEEQFCKNWQARIGKVNAFDEASAIHILSSSTYQQEFSGIYKRFYDVLTWKKLIQQRKLRVYNFKSIDTIFTAAMDYDEIPNRRNVSQERFLTPKSVPQKVMNKLLSDDLSITNYLERNLSDPHCRDYWPWSLNE